MIESQNRSTPETSPLFDNFAVSNPEGRENLQREIRGALSGISVRLSSGPGVGLGEITKAISDKLAGKTPFVYRDSKTPFAPQFGYAIKSPMGYHEVKVEIKEGKLTDVYHGRYYALFEIASPPEPGVEVVYSMTR